MRVLLVVLALTLEGCAGTSEPDGGDTDPAVAGPLADDRFAFCHEEGADADQVARWCALLEEAPPEACPGMRATCEAGVFTAEPTGCQGPGGVGSGLGGDLEDEDPWRRRDATGCETLDGELASQVIRWGAALMIAVLVVVLVRLLLVQLGWVRARPVSRTPAVLADDLPAEIEGDDDLPAMPEDRMLVEARRALDEGRLGDAVVWARGAALRRLARRGELRLHRARTDREYVRTVRRQPEVATALEDIVGAVEDHRWAGRVLTRIRAASAVDAAARLLAVAALALLLLPADAQAARRYGPYGDAALLRLADAAGWRRLHQMSWLADVDATIDLVVLDLDVVVPTPADREALTAWVEEGGILVVTGDPGGWLPGLGEHVRFTGEDPDDLVAGPWLLNAGMAVPVWPGRPSSMFCHQLGVPLVELPVGAPRVALADAGTGGAGDTDALGDTDPQPPALPDVDCPAPAIAQALPVERGWVIGVADGRILLNGAMLLASNRRFLFDLLGPDGPAALPDEPTVVFATTSGTQGARDPWEAVANARLVPFVLHLTAAWLLLAMALGWPLSPLRDPPAVTRRDFAEHAGALGRHWARAGASRHAAAAFARLELRRLGSDGLAAAALRAGRDPRAARELVLRTEALAEAPEGPDAPADIDLVEELWSITRRRST